MNNTIDNVYNNYPLLNIHINIYIYTLFNSEIQVWMSQNLMSIQKQFKNKNL